MRDLLILGIVLASLPFAVRHTWIAVILWTWLSVMNPHKLAFGFAYNAPFAALAAGAALLSLVVTRDKLRMVWDPAVVVLCMFVLWMCVTTAFAIDPGGSWVQLSKVLKIQLMTAVALVALQERKHIEFFVWINILSIGYYGFKGGLFTIVHGGAERVWGPPGGFIEDNNALAVAIIMVVPLANYLRLVSTRPWIRRGLMLLMLLCTVSALGSQSRGALLAVCAMGLVFWYRSDRKVLVAVVIAVLAVGLLAFMPESWHQRMASMTAYEEESSAMSRIMAWKFSVNLANHRPLGGGFEIYTWGNYAVFGPPGATMPQAAHSIYFSVLGEHGYFGLLLFVVLWWMTLRIAGGIRKEARNKANAAWIYHLAGMCQVSLIGYLVGGAFLQLAYFDLPYNILVILVAAKRWLRDGTPTQSMAGAFWSAEPSSSLAQAGIAKRLQT